WCRWRCRWLCAVSPATVESGGTIVETAPDDHFSAGPDCGVESSGMRSVDDARSYPTIRSRIVSPSSVKAAKTGATPHDHFVTSPESGVIAPGRRRVPG